MPCAAFVRRRLLLLLGAPPLLGPSPSPPASHALTFARARGVAGHISSTSSSTPRSTFLIVSSPRFGAAGARARGGRLARPARRSSRAAPPPAPPPEAGSPPPPPVRPARAIDTRACLAAHGAVAAAVDLRCRRRRSPPMIARARTATGVRTGTGGSTTYRWMYRISNVLSCMPVHIFPKYKSFPSVLSPKSPAILPLVHEARTCNYTRTRSTSVRLSKSSVPPDTCEEG